MCLLKALFPNANDSHHGVPQAPITGPFLLFIYINDLQRAVEYCKDNQFADNVRLLNFSNSIKGIIKQVIYRNLENFGRRKSS